MYAYEYKLDAKGRRVLAGLSFEETTEFEMLEAELPMYHTELRWLELFNKHDHAREAEKPARKLASRPSTLEPLRS